MMNKKTKKLIWGTMVSLFIILIALIAGGNYLVGFALRPENRGKDLEGSMKELKANYPSIVQWVDSLEAHRALKDTFLTAPDGVKLHAYYVKAASHTGKTAMIVHGYTDNAIRMFHIGYLYHHDLGYNIIVPDLRYSGLSEGDAIQMGWLDRKDVEMWIRHASDILKNDSLQMVVHGISMGAATTMMISGDPQADFVKCFVEDCGYTSVWDQFKKQLNEQFSLPAFPILYVASGICQWRYGWGFKEASALEQVRKSTLPMLFIHGEKDTYVPTFMVQRLYDAKKGEKQLWIAPAAEHAASYRLHPEEYTRRVHAFLQQYIH